MKSRLEALSPEVAQEINSLPLSEASERALCILSKRLALLPDKVAKILPGKFEIQSCSVSKIQIDALDGCYLSAEEAGNDEGASASFMAARFLSAVHAWQAAESHFELCEAVYEAQFAQN